MITKGAPFGVLIKMTLVEYDKAIRLDDNLGRNDREWFPKWVRRYALGFRGGLKRNLPVNRHAVIEFSKGLLKSGAPAWQRWQAVRAIECYRNSILKRSEPAPVRRRPDVGQIGTEGKKSSLGGTAQRRRIRKAEGQY